MAERNSGHTRDPLDWYIEPQSCVHTLFNVVQFEGTIHDPCCGTGNIVKVARARGYRASGSDIVDRGFGFPVHSFFDMEGPLDNCVCNPPFREAVRVVEHALRLVRSGGLVAAIGQSKFLWSQRRVDLFDRCERITILSTRPSMPKGEALLEFGEDIRGGGSIDYAWCIWRAGVVGPTDCKIEWML
jgi:hypothetical protein